MNGTAIFGDEQPPVRHTFLQRTIRRHPAIWRGKKPREETMTGAMAAFEIAVSGSSLICYVLMTRMENRRADRRWSRDGCLPDSGNYSSGDGWSLSNWFGGDNSSFDIQAIRPIQAEAMAQAAVMQAVVTVIRTAQLRAKRSNSDLPDRNIVFRFIPVCIRDHFGITSKDLISFCIPPRSSISMASHHRRTFPFP